MGGVAADATGGDAVTPVVAIAAKAEKAIVCFSFRDMVTFLFE
jgi:hypothetical protein